MAAATEAVTLTAEKAAALRKELDAFIAVTGSLVRNLDELEAVGDA
jgi:hypothetical protein